jgi:4-aminobutyrate aminotransferase
MQNAVEMGEYLMENLREMMPRHLSIGDVRGKGLMIGIEFVKDRDTREPAKAVRDQIVEDAFRQGLLLLGAGEAALRLMPALMIDKASCDEALTILDRVLTGIENGSYH